MVEGVWAVKDVFKVELDLMRLDVTLFIHGKPSN